MDFEPFSPPTPQCHALITQHTTSGPSQYRNYLPKPTWNPKTDFVKTSALLQRFQTGFHLRLCKRIFPRSFKIVLVLEIRTDMLCNFSNSPCSIADVHPGFIGVHSLSLMTLALEPQVLRSYTPELETLDLRKQVRYFDVWAPEIATHYGPSLTFTLDWFRLLC